MKTKRKVSCSGIISALIFIAAKAECQFLATALDTPLIASFRQNPDTMAGGKEALPLPMAVVVAFEWRVRLAETPRWEKLVLGAYLGMIWGGLR